MSSVHCLVLYHLDLFRLALFCPVSDFFFFLILRFLPCLGFAYLALSRLDFLFLHLIFLLIKKVSRKEKKAYNIANRGK